MAAKANDNKITWGGALKGIVKIAAVVAVGIATWHLGAGLAGGLGFTDTAAAMTGLATSLASSLAGATSYIGGGIANLFLGAGEVTGEAINSIFGAADENVVSPAKELATKTADYIVNNPGTTAAIGGAAAGAGALAYKAGKNNGKREVVGQWTAKLAQQEALAQQLPTRST